MHTRALGKIGVAVGEVGLGTWQFGGDWGDVSEEQALETMRAALESGTTFFDTADVYGQGRSESLVGRFLKDHRCDVFVATKLGRFPEPGGPENFTFESFRRFTQASIRRLGVEALELTQLHTVPTEQLQRGDVFDWLRTLKQEGLLLNFGASVESMDQALLCLEQEGLASLQIIFNVFRQKPIEALFAKAKEKGVAIVVRLPLASGLLAGKYTKETTFAPQDHRTFNRDGQALTSARPSPASPSRRAWT
jgi:aryl-alcohol dehydrogenase-like predicted oxidoreductase